MLTPACRAWALVASFLTAATSEIVSDKKSQCPEASCEAPAAIADHRLLQVSSRVQLATSIRATGDATAGDAAAGDAPDAVRGVLREEVGWALQPLTDKIATDGLKSVQPVLSNDLQTVKTSAAGVAAQAAAISQLRSALGDVALQADPHTVQGEVDAQEQATRTDEEQGISELDRDVGQTKGFLQQIYQHLNHPLARPEDDVRDASMLIDVAKMLVNKYGSASVGWKAADANHDGSISRDEWATHCAASGVRLARVDADILFTQIDILETGGISQDDYRHLYEKARASAGDSKGSALGHWQWVGAWPLGGKKPSKDQGNWQWVPNSLDGLFPKAGAPPAGAGGAKGGVLGGGAAGMSPEDAAKKAAADAAAAAAAAADAAAKKSRRRCRCGCRQSRQCDGRCLQAVHC